MRFVMTVDPNAVGVFLKDPRELEPALCGAILGRWIRHQVPEHKRDMYNAWVAKLVADHVADTLTISPDGDVRAEAVSAYLAGLLHKVSPSKHWMREKRDIVEQLADALVEGKATLVKGPPL